MQVAKSHKKKIYILQFWLKSMKAEKVVEHKATNTWISQHQSIEVLKSYLLNLNAI